MGNKRQAAVGAVDQAFRSALSFHERGELQRAEHLYREVLRQQPRHAGALNMLGVVGCQSGQFGAGADLIRRAVDLEPSNPEFHNNLGMALLEGGDLAAAIAAFEQAVSLRPRYAEAQCNLANALVRREDFERAEQHYARALRAAPDFADALNNYGNLLRQRGRAAEALKPLGRLVRKVPDFAPGHYNLALAEQACGHHDAAIAAYRRAIELAPKEAGFRRSLADCLRLRGDLAAAEQAYLEAMDAGERTVPLLNAVGLTRYARNLVDEAETCFNEAQELDPGNAVTLNHLGMVASARGDRERAATCFAQALDREPALGDAWRNLVETGVDAAQRERLIARIEAVLATEPAAVQVPDLYYALGALHDAADDTERAFDAFARANEIQHHDSRFSAGAQAAFMDSLAEVFDSAFFARPSSVARPGEQPVFIVGMPRSGTTLVEQIVGTHRDCHAAGELTFFPQRIPALGRALVRPRPFPTCLLHSETELLDGLADEYLELLAQRGGGAARVTDKMPYNFLYLGVIARLFPQARVIHCRREPMATCFSIFTKNLAGSHPYAYSLADLGHSYRNYARLMAHWETVLPNAMFGVDYEQLVAEPEAVSRALVTFLGLDWDPACLQPERNERAVTTASQWQVRRPVYTSSVTAWRRYAQHLEPLRAALAGQPS